MSDPIARLREVTKDAQFALAWAGFDHVVKEKLALTEFDDDGDKRTCLKMLYRVIHRPGSRRTELLIRALLKDYIDGQMLPRDLIEDLFINHFRPPLLAKICPTPKILAQAVDDINLQLLRAILADGRVSIGDSDAILERAVLPPIGPADTVPLLWCGGNETVRCRLGLALDKADYGRSQHLFTYLEERMQCIKLMMRHHHRELSFFTHKAIPNALESLLNDDVSTIILEFAGDLARGHDVRRRSTSMFFALDHLIHDIKHFFRPTGDPGGNLRDNRNCNPVAVTYKGSLWKGVSAREEVGARIGCVRRLEIQPLGEPLHRPTQFVKYSQVRVHKFPESMRVLDDLEIGIRQFQNKWGPEVEARPPVGLFRPLRFEFGGR